MPERSERPPWSQVPFLKLLVPLIVGISIGQAHPVEKHLLLIGEALVFMGWLLLRFQSPFQQFTYGFIRGISLQLLLLLSGMHLLHSRDMRNHPQWYGHIQDAHSYITKVAEAPQRKSNSFVTRLSILWVYNGRQLIAAKGDLLAYLSVSIDAMPKYGDILQFNARPQLIPSSRNPGSFDYADYCHRNHLYDRIYLGPQSFVHTVTANTNDWYTRMQKTRHWVVHQLQQFIQSEREAGLAEALLIGYKENLDPELTLLYANTGVIHIIAISGLHLGILYALLQFLLGLFPRSRYQRILSPVLVCGALWAFSLLAGAAPSVLRAAVMFSFLAIGQGISRKASTYNLLFASAFGLLLYNPYWLFDTGFQLSYAALLGILLFHRPIYILLQTGKKLPDLIINLLAVTLAAQAMTLPLTLYYFKQFPVYFLVSNLVAVPLSSLLLIGALLLCLTTGWPAFAAMLGTILKTGITLMNTFIYFLDQLPGAVWAPLYISLIQAALLTLCLIAIVVWIYRSSRAALWGAAGFAWLVVGLRAADFWKCRWQQTVVVYHSQKSFVLDFIDGQTAYTLIDSNTLTDIHHRNILRGSHAQFRITRALRIPWNGKSPCGYRQGPYAVVVLAEGGPLPVLPTQRLPVILCMKSREYFPIDSLQLNICQVVLWGSAPEKTLRRWAQAGKRWGIPIHPVVEKGAFVMQLR